MILLVLALRMHLGLIFFLPLLPGVLFGIRKMFRIWLMMFLMILTSELMGVGSLSLILMLRLLGLVLLFIIRLSSLIVIIGVMLRILIIHMRAALTSSRGSFILALQAYSGLHFGIDNLNVLRGWLLSRNVPRSPLPLMKDGDLLTTIRSMLSLRGFDTVKVSKVKGHATRAMVAGGDVRLEDLVGNNGADAAADLGRLRQHDDVITARRDLLRVRRLWYPIMHDLHRFIHGCYFSYRGQS